MESSASRSAGAGACAILRLDPGDPRIASQTPGRAAEQRGAIQDWVDLSTRCKEQRSGAAPCAAQDTSASELAALRGCRHGDEMVHAGQGLNMRFEAPRQISRAKQPLPPSKRPTAPCSVSSGLRPGAVTVAGGARPRARPSSNRSPTGFETPTSQLSRSSEGRRDALAEMAGQWLAFLFASVVLIPSSAGPVGTVRSYLGADAVPRGCRGDRQEHQDPGQAREAVGGLAALHFGRGATTAPEMRRDEGMSLRLRGGRLLSMPDKYYKKRKVHGSAPQRALVETLIPSASLTRIPDSVAGSPGER